MTGLVKPPEPLKGEVAPHDRLMTWPLGVALLHVQKKLSPQVGNHGVACFSRGKRNDHMQKSDTAWRTAARMAALADETDDEFEREHFIRLRDAWITLANRCEPFDVPDVTEK